MHGGISKDQFQAAVPGDSFTVFKVQAWSLKLEPLGCPETSVTNYQSTFLIIAEDQTSLIGGLIRCPTRKETSYNDKRI